MSATRWPSAPEPTMMSRYRHQPMTCTTENLCQRAHHAWRRRQGARGKRQRAAANGRPARRSRATQARGKRRRATERNGSRAERSALSSTHALQRKAVAEQHDGKVGNLDGAGRKKGDKDEPVPLVRVVFFNKVAKAAGRIHAVDLKRRPDR